MNQPANTAAPDPRLTMRSIIQRIATGPELSKDISLDEARAGMRYILEGRVDPVQAGIFLIALRMKRETDDENLGVLDAIREQTLTATAPVDDVVDISDPYDGYNRSLPAAPFLPAVLAACGVPAVSHGVESVGPKYGVTHRQVLRAAGQPVDLDVAEAAARLGDPRIGWSYVDQSRYCPKLHALTDFRSLIVKRPVITTVETLTGPIRGARRTHLVSGYVHKPYPRIYAMLARHAGFESALIIRGVEGGVIPSLRQTGRAFFYHDQGVEQSIELDPAEFDIVQTLRAPPLPPGLAHNEDGDEVAAPFDAALAARAAADAGLAALDGVPGPTRDGLIYTAALSLWHLRRADSLRAAADRVRAAIDSGAARARLAG